MPKPKVPQLNVTAALSQLDYRRLITGLSRKENTQYRKANGEPNQAAFIQAAIKEKMDKEGF